MYIRYVSMVQVYPLLSTFDGTGSVFIGNPNILHLFDGVQRIINRKDPWRATHDNGIDGLRTIHKLQYAIDKDSANPLDNVHMINDNNMFIINIATFMTGIKFEHDNYHKYDLREPPRKIIRPDNIKTTKIDHITDDWSNIPFYPTAEKRNEMIQTYGQKQAEKIIDYSYENSTDPTKEIIPPNNYESKNNESNTNNRELNNHEKLLTKIQQYNETMRQINSNNRIIPPNVNKFSPAYSKIIAVKPKASKSANIRLGGVYR